jgi:PAS domain S-box-containing protein
MKPQANLPSKWILASLIVLISLGLTLIGYLFYSAQEKAVQEASFNQLTSIANLKVDQIIQWRKERMGDLHVTAESPFFSEPVLRLLDNPDDEGLRASIAERLVSLKTYYDYENTLIVAPDGSLLFSLQPDVTALDPETVRLARQTAAAQTFQFGDFFRSTQDGKVYLDLAGPILDSSGRAAAVLVLRIDPDLYLYPLIQTWPTPSQTAETLLIRAEGDGVTYLNTLRHKADPPLSIHLALTNTELPAAQAANGKRGQTEGLDYRGVPVVADINPIPGTDWFMISKIDQAEIHEQVLYIGRFVALLVLFSILFSGALLVVFFNSRQGKLYQNLYESERARLIALEEVRTILYSIGDGVIATDDQGRVKLFNPIAETLTGWTEKEASGRNLTEVFNIVNEYTHEMVENPVYRVLREGNIVGLANHTILIPRAGDGHPIADSGAPVKDAHGRITGVVLVFRDQTEERAIQRERALLSNTIAASLDEVYLFDFETLKFRFANTGALKNLGYTLEEMTELTPVDIKPEVSAERFQEILRPLIDRSLPIQIFETIHQRKDGSLYPVEVHLQLYEGEGEKLFMAIIQDITGRRKSEDEIHNLNSSLEQRIKDRTVQLEASNKELEAFAYSISHDLRAPLRGIDGWSQALLEDNAEQLDEKGRLYLSRVRSETQRMGNLIDDLLELSRVTRSDMQTDAVNLSELAEGIMARLRDREPGRRVEFQLTKGLTVRGDRQLLETMLVNLLDNAWKFTSLREVAKIEFGSYRQDGREVFYVRDNGAGFNMNYSTKLFGAFQRLHKQNEYPGTGIGLATVQRIIHRHGGAIWTEAKPEEGATFFFTL